MNTSPVRMDDLPLNRFHCRIAALTFGAHLTDGYVLGVIGYAIIQLTPAMQLTPFMAGMIGGSALLGFVSWQPGFGVDLRPYRAAKNLHLQFYADYACFVFTVFATTPEHLIGLRILIGIGLGGDYSVGHTLLAEFSPRRHRGIFAGRIQCGVDRRLCAGKYCRTSLYFRKPGGLALAAGISGVTSLADYAATLGHAGIATLATAPGGVLQKLTLSFIAIFGPHVLLGDEVATATHKHIKTLFSSRYWRRTAFNSVFFVCLVIPWFVIYTGCRPSPKTIGLEDALTASLMLNALLIVGALLGLVLTHLLAHRRFLLGSFLLLAATLVVMACLPSGSSLTLLLLFSSAPPFRQSVIWWAFCLRKVFLLTFARWASVLPPP